MNEFNSFYYFRRPCSYAKLNTIRCPSFHTHCLRSFSLNLSFSLPPNIRTLAQARRPITYLIDVAADLHGRCQVGGRGYACNQLRAMGDALVDDDQIIIFTNSNAALHGMRRRGIPGPGLHLKSTIEGNAAIQNVIDQSLCVVVIGVPQEPIKSLIFIYKIKRKRKKRKRKRKRKKRVSVKETGQTSGKYSSAFFIPLPLCPQYIQYNEDPPRPHTVNCDEVRFEE